MDFEGKPLNIGGQVSHREEDDEVCSVVLHWDETSPALNCDGFECKLRECYKVGEESITKDATSGEWTYDSGKLDAYSSTPWNLKGDTKDVFPEHNFWLNYDRSSPINLCGMKPARKKLYCRM